MGLTDSHAMQVAVHIPWQSKHYMHILPILKCGPVPKDWSVDVSVSGYRLLKKKKHVTEIVYNLSITQYKVMI